MERKQPNNAESSPPYTGAITYEKNPSLGSADPVDHSNLVGSPRKVVAL